MIYSTSYFNITLCQPIWFMERKIKEEDRKSVLKYDLWVKINVFVLSIKGSRCNLSREYAVKLQVYGSFFVFHPELDFELVVRKIHLHTVWYILWTFLEIAVIQQMKTNFIPTPRGSSSNGTNQSSSMTHFGHWSQEIAWCETKQYNFLAEIVTLLICLDI